MERPEALVALLEQSHPAALSLCSSRNCTCATDSAARTYQQCHNIQRNYYVEPLQNGPFNPRLLGPGSNHYINITTATRRLLGECMCQL